MLNVTGTTFIRDNLRGGFALYEHMAMIMPIVDSFVVVDVGSTDGTFETLQELAKYNSRIKVVRENWTTTNNPKAFADIANRCVELCPTPHVFFRQADEIMHKDLAKAVKANYENGIFEMTFERIQLSHGLNQVKWLPHPVCGGLTKGNRHYDKDGMTTNSHPPCMMCSNPANGRMGESRGFPWHMPKEGMLFDSNNPTALNQIMNELFPWEYFLIDISSSFRDNQIAKHQLHAPFWNENANSFRGKPTTDWLRDAMTNPLWTKKQPEFTRLPKILHGLIGEPKYFIRNEVIESLKSDNYDIWLT